MNGLLCQSDDKSPATIRNVVNVSYLKLNYFMINKLKFECISKCFVLNLSTFEYEWRKLLGFEGLI